MFKIIQIMRDTKRLVDIANAERIKNGGEASFGFWFTNRSFLVPAITLLVNFLVMLGLPWLQPLTATLSSVSPDFIANNIVELSMAVALIWSFFERAFSKGMTIWNRKQGMKAVEQSVGPGYDEPDALTAALNQALSMRHPKEVYKEAVAK